MNLNKQSICQCTMDAPVLLNGSLPISPLNCMRCKRPVPLVVPNVPDELTDAFSKWGRIYSSLFTLWRDSVEYRGWAKQKLLDETGSINLEGLMLAQQYNLFRSTFYWMFRDISDKDYMQPQHCPFCSASMMPLLDNDFKVCHACKVAYPDRKIT